MRKNDKNLTKSIQRQLSSLFYPGKQRRLKHYALSRSQFSWPQSEYLVNDSLDETAAVKPARTLEAREQKVQGWRLVLEKGASAVSGQQRVESAFDLPGEFQWLGVPEPQLVVRQLRIGLQTRAQHHFQSPASLIA